MLDPDSHIRMNGKRQAVDALEAFRAEEALRSLSQADAETVP
jgi:hypothetical protein